jgi:hypothetical protein
MCFAEANKLKSLNSHIGLDVSFTTVLDPMEISGKIFQ